MEEKEKRPNPHLRRERELKGWSQRTLAERLGTTEHVVNRWESGLHRPNRHFQTHLCQLFGKRADELGFMGEPQKTIEEVKEAKFTSTSSSLPFNQQDETCVHFSQAVKQGIIGIVRELARDDMDQLRRQLLQQILNIISTALLVPSDSLLRYSEQTSVAQPTGTSLLRLYEYLLSLSWEHYYTSSSQSIALAVARQHLGTELTRWKSRLLIADAETYLAENDPQGCCVVIVEAFKLVRMTNSRSNEMRINSLYHQLKDSYPRHSLVCQLGEQLRSS